MGTTQSDPSGLPHVNNIAGWRGTVDISLYSEYDVSYIMGTIWWCIYIACFNHRQWYVPNICSIDFETKLNFALLYSIIILSLNIWILVFQSVSHSVGIKGNNGSSELWRITAQIYYYILYISSNCRTDRMLPFAAWWLAVMVMILTKLWFANAKLRICLISS